MDAHPYQGCVRLAQIEENMVTAFTEVGGADNNRLTVALNRAYYVSGTPDDRSDVQFFTVALLARPPRQVRGRTCQSHRSGRVARPVHHRLQHLGARDLAYPGSAR